MTDYEYMYSLNLNILGQNSNVQKVAFVMAILNTRLTPLKYAS